MELARTVLRWRRPNGGLKARECREFLERLDAEGAVVLPDKRRGRAVGSVTRVPRTAAGEPGRPLSGSVRDVEPLECRGEPPSAWCSGSCGVATTISVTRFPFGAHLRYLVFASRPRGRWSGACSFRVRRGGMSVRDRWVGWDESARVRNLQRVVNNSRFLLLPWVRVKNLASAVLSRGLGQLRVDWPRRYHLAPWLVETLVDARRHHGGCYRAANLLRWAPRAVAAGWTGTAAVCGCGAADGSGLSSGPGCAAAVAEG